MRAPVRRQLRDVGAKKFYLSGIRLEVAGDLVEQSGLAGAIGPDDQPAFARPYRKRHVLRHWKAAKGLVQVDDLERVRRCRHRGPPRSRAASLCRPGVIPVGITSTMNRNTSPSSMFQRST